MIHHLSIAAREPEQVAGVLAEPMGGIAVPDAENFFVRLVSGAMRDQVLCIRNHDRRCGCINVLAALRLQFVNE